MKSYGGLAHVRRISSSELAQWTVKMGFMINILVLVGMCQDMYPSELKLKRANESEENNSWSIKIKTTFHLFHEPVPNEHTWGVR
jgi:hypothetical protein